MKKKKKSWFSLCVFPDRIMIPTDYRTEAGFYVAGEPIAMIPIANKSAFVAALETAIKTGNPSIATPPRDELSNRTVLEKAAGFSSWDELEKGSIPVTVWVYDDEFKIQSFARKTDRTWSDKANSEAYLSTEQGIEALADAILNLLKDRRDLPGLTTAPA